MRNQIRSVVATVGLLAMFALPARAPAIDFPTPGEFNKATPAEQPATNDDGFPLPGALNPNNDDESKSQSPMEFPTPGEYEKPGSQPELPSVGGSQLSETVVNEIWKVIDANKDGRATDKELDKAVRGVRRLANSREESVVRDAIRAKFDTDKSDLLDESEAELCLCEVRGLKCPTAREAREFWASLDRDGSKTVTPEEFRARLQPLGQVGAAVNALMGNTLDKMDGDKNHAIDETEMLFSANTMLRVKMATDGQNLAKRDPGDWVEYLLLAAQLDADADNTVSPQESLAFRPVAANFARIDRNRDQQITVSELCDFDDQIERQIAAAEAASLAGARQARTGRMISGSC